MTHPNDLVERVAKAMYEDEAARVSSADTAPYWTWGVAVPASKAYWKRKACVSLNEAGSWLTDHVAKPSDAPSAKALKLAARDPALYRKGGE